jgi:antitoxin (DNA-binding transcriptional repressor) of toxin-antitoxin stability system
MIVTATELANDSKAVVDRVIAGGESVQVQRHGKTVVEIRRKAGVSRAEFLDRLKALQFTESEQRELKQAMRKAAEAFGYAGGD